MTLVERRTILLLSLGTFALMGFADVYFLLPAYYSISGPMDPGRVGWIIGIFYVSTFFRPFVGWLVDMFGFRKLFRGALVLCTGGVAAFGLFQGVFPAMMLSRVAMGTGFSLVAVGLTAYQSLAFPTKGSGAAFALSSAAGILPLLLVTPVAEWLVNHRFPFLFLFVLPLVCLAGAFWASERLPSIQDAPEPGRAPGPGFLSAAASLLGQARSRALILSITLFCIVDALLLNLSGLTAGRGIAVSGFLGASALSSFLTRLLGRSILDRIPRMRTVSSSYAITALVLVLVATPLANTSFRMVMCGLLFGFASGYGYPLHLALIGEVAEPALRPHLSSLFWFFMGLCYFLVPPLQGTLARTTGTALAFQGLSLLVLVGAFIMHTRVWRSLEG